MAGRQWTLQTVYDRCEEIGDCWIWAQSLKANGIPQACIDGKGGRNVRTYIYDVLSGKKRPPKSTVGSTCNERRCCNPAHLVWRSRSQVVSSSYKSGARHKFSLTLDRRERAVRNGWAKLTMEQAQEIRFKAATMRRKDLAAEYGVVVSTIREIINGNLWKPLDGHSIFNLGG